MNLNGIVYNKTSYMNGVMDMISEEKVTQMSRLFKLISDPTRIRILYVLESNAMTVTKLVEALQMNQTTVSHQLRILRDNNLVSFKKQGREIVYSLTDAHVHTIFTQASEHVLECIF